MVAYVSTSGSNKNVHVLKITPHIKMSETVHLVGWLTACVNPRGSVTPDQLHKEDFWEMRFLQDGMKALMATFGHEDVAIFFRTGQSVKHRLHVHVLPMSNYTSKVDDWQMADVIDAIESGTSPSPERSPEPEQPSKRGTACIVKTAGAINSAVAVAERSIQEEKEREWL